MRITAVLLLALAACTPGEASRSSDRPPASPAGDGGAGASDTTVAPGSAAAATDTARRAEPSGIVRGLYVNRFAAQGTRRMRQLLDVADSTEINAFVIDVKDEFGLNYASRDPAVARNAGGREKIRDLKALVDTLESHGVLPIARIVVFKDSVAARVNPDHVIRREDGSAWRDKQGLAWVNPYDRAIWEYNIGVAEEMIALGFDEIQFDYIRFPEPYRSLPRQVFPGANGVSKPKVLRQFLETACARIRAKGARCTADIFGLVTTVKGALEVGQEWEELAAAADVLLPMVYPSHYPRGAYGIARPNADPYRVVRTAIDAARRRDAALGITTPEHVRPWLQAFSLGQPPYEAHHVREQKRAVYDAGYDGWILWHPGSKYEPFLAALERETVSRKQAPGAAGDSAARK
jgi:hypothetical protein